MVRLLRPLIARRLRQPKAGAASTLAPNQPRGPFAELVEAFGDLPLAANLRDTIDAAWAPSTLSQQLKALVFAVVARGIGCAPAEHEAVRLAVDAGRTPEQIANDLAHLSGAGLDDLEQAAASLARESIWYRPASLQRHARSIRSRFSRQQFVELVGLTALANAVCRLCVTAEIARQPA
jgi:alkylhydroperoxidase family enzyme